MIEIYNPDSQGDVVTTVTHVLKAFEDIVSAEITNLNIAYDEELSYETGIKAIVAKYNYNNSPGDLLKPAFIYNRTAMRVPINGIQQRLNSFKSYKKLSSGDSVNFTATHAEFDIQFLFASKSIEEQERFEVAYQAEEGISFYKEIEVSMGDQLGVFKYFVSWPPDLTEKTIQADDIYIKGLAGMATVRGVFFVFTGTAKVIEQIKLDIFLTRQLNIKEELVKEIIIE